MSIVNISNLEQTGGYKSLQIAPVDEIITMPNIITNTNANLVSINSASTTISIIPVSESIKITSPRKRVNGIFQYTIKISVDFFYQTTALDDFLNDYLSKKVVVVAVTSFGAEKLFGSKLHPLTFDYEFIDGKRPEDIVKTRVTITAKIPQKPVFIKD